MASANDSRPLIDINQIPPPSPASPVAEDTIPTEVPILPQNAFQDPFGDHLLRVNPAQQRANVQGLAAAPENDIRNQNNMRRWLRAIDAAMERRVLRKRNRTRIYARSSKFRGVNRTTRGFEAFVWDNSDPRERAKTVYIGVFDREGMAARARDLVALKFWGTSTILNFPVSSYERELEAMKTISKEDYLMAIRRMSKGFARGPSQYRGVFRKPSTANPNVIRWQARLGRGQNYRGIYLGTFTTARAAARAYDVAAIRVRGPLAATNFSIGQYKVANILRSQDLRLGKGTSRQFLIYSMDEILERLRIDQDRANYDQELRMQQLLQPLNMPGGAGAGAAGQNQNPAPPKPEPVAAAVPFVMTSGAGSTLLDLNLSLNPCKVEPMEGVGESSGAPMNTAGVGNAGFGGSQVSSFLFPWAGGRQTPLYLRGFNSNNGALQPPFPLLQPFARPPYPLDPTTLQIQRGLFTPYSHFPDGVAAGNPRVPNIKPFAENGDGWLSL